MAFDFLKKFNSCLYIQLWDNRITVTNSNGEKVYDDVPFIAFRKSGKNQMVVDDIGHKAKFMKHNNNQVINPFTHPRTIINDFYAAEKLIQMIIQSIFQKRFISPSPVVIFHPMETFEGGLTMIEDKALREVMLGAGARESVIYQGSDLKSPNIDYKKVCSYV
jgi:rod shape-determining protein MreB